MTKIDSERMLQCFKDIAYPEKRCRNRARWVSAHCLPPVNKFVWCDEHKSDGCTIIEDEERHRQTA